ncbi:MAG: response regulator [Actinobacteria bacterium]|nr:response regulator [Actinomycetota bacterium]
MSQSARLYLRFAAASAAVIAAVGGALLWSIHHQEDAQAQRNVAVHARFIAKAILREELTAANLRAPVTGAELVRLDRLFRTRVLIDGGLRAKLYRPDGLVTYSDLHSLIRSHADDMEEIHTVLGGKVVRDVSRINHEGGTGANVKALEVYVPLALPGQAKPTAVLEIYQSYAPVAQEIRSFAVLLLLALLGMWVALFPLIQRMVVSLERHRAARRTAELALEETSEQLRQSQKMDAIGRLAGGVAHDFNNLLLAINGYSEFLSDTLTDERQKRFATEIRAAGERAAALTQQLLAFSRRQVLQPRVIDINNSVREIESILKRVIGAEVRVVLDLEPSLRLVEADPSQIGQVLLNLAVNARDAMDGRGTIKVVTRNDAAHVVLEVVDTGVGMDEETRGRIFEPFFTTKDIGQGTGLGLSTVYGIVAQSGGTISVRSEPGLGAAFSVRLPVCEKPAEPVAAIEPPVQLGGERILIVDDEKVVRELLAQMLRQQGYNVTVAASAREARALDASWDVLVTDVVMPETDGVRLSRELDARYVLFISGYDQEALVTSDASFLQKPFSRDDLARSVRSLLDGHRIAA